MTPGIAAFRGFPKDTITFLRALARHNTTEWVESNRLRYDAALLTPARHCVVAVGKALHAAGCDVVADPRVNGSIFRMASDRRFHQDALPYKTHLALLWWAEGVRMGQPSFYLQVNRKGIELGVGLPEVPRDQLPRFRRWLATGDHASQFLAAMDVASGHQVEWSLRRLARPPLEFRGLSGDAAEAVRFTGGWGGWTLDPHPPELFTAAFTEWFVERCRPLMPFFHQLEHALQGSRSHR
jgi:uncharacterized protein (TIGR02453 family)